ncbi:hypothetical protein AGABI1DRAFT_100018 [Agaricus bisporus var. burnettii JB137-S8]|uniref:Protein-lysine N-methyltransferase EFM6 n=1 Tax=Agaricus bisporus var. burnettii (strain JB137-S8 / ATCC MYA-4627 / FGSC 10392) TaxID=597362 RepID=K5W0U2_AGABU|nr:uncharacterized protein AGABI1DRAFT_100018 [Agaricus bisporus var. burnettii JB137-S8]EKM80414.1 hypothetical protein AGABI1DRAFT_100018 [Agaricus bisporus var. burnettii JB137-S8]
MLKGSRKSQSELLSVLPHQHFSESNGVLDLTFSISVGQSLSVKLIVDSKPGCGGIAWPAGQVMPPLIVLFTYKTANPLGNKCIVELGSGTGLVGLVAGKLDPTCKVYITDQAPLLDIMNKNVALNSLEENVEVSQLNWALIEEIRGEPIPSGVPSKADIILAADCVYFEPAFPLLVQTLSDLSDAKTVILFCYRKRRRADKRFFSLLKKRFSWCEVVDDPNRTIYNKEAITLLRLFKTDGRKGK